MSLEYIGGQLKNLHDKYEQVEGKTDKILTVLTHTRITAVIFAVAVVSVLVVGIWIG